ncbi:MAG: toll/interleukin-1 receptor domain-containing protein [Chitinophagaceae bacterium]
MMNLFFSYSHKDEDLRDELDKHLTILKRKGIINTWHDRRIEAGSMLASEISTNLKSANIILLLVSSDFLASDYCYNVEMKEAMRMHKERQAVVIPVILRPCDWQDTLFGELLATPKDGKPVIKFPGLDEAFLEINNEIKRVVSTLSKKGMPIEEPVTNQVMDMQPRSSNLRIAKTFSDHDKDKFLDDAFLYISNYFEASLIELKKRNPQVDSRFKRIDSQTFTASLYIDGTLKSECMIFFGGMLGLKGINYSRQISSSRNSLNESLTLSDDGHLLQLRSTGMSFSNQNREINLTNEGAAEFYWEMFIAPLQER